MSMATTAPILAKRGGNVKTASLCGSGLMAAMDE
jgi:hypothetical protein